MNLYTIEFNNSNKHYALMLINWLADDFKWVKIRRDPFKVYLLNKKLPNDYKKLEVYRDLLITALKNNVIIKQD